MHEGGRGERVHEVGGASTCAGAGRAHALGRASKPRVLLARAREPLFQDAGSSRMFRVCVCVYLLESCRR